MTETAVATEQRTFAEKLDKLAEVAVRVGLGLQPGQELVMTASLDSIALARRITEHAYRAGASLVTTLYGDDEAVLMRYRNAPDASFDHAAKWLYDGMAEAFKSGAARLAIAGANPSLLSNEDPEKVGRANRAVSQAYRPALELITRHEINWTIVAGATPAWASAMFPNDAPDVVEMHKRYVSPLLTFRHNTMLLFIPLAVAAAIVFRFRSEFERFLLVLSPVLVLFPTLFLRAWHEVSP